ncbi:hypothetical protein ACLKA7_004633 [Drosophila subpalustris]
MEKFCFCIPLRWGMLIIAFIDTILDILGLVALGLEFGSWTCDLDTTSHLYRFHLIGCMLLVVSIWDQKPEFITPYMMSAIFRLIKITRFTIHAFLDMWLFVAIVHSMILLSCIFFVVCAYFWYSKLKNES